MKLTATEFRKQLFPLLERALGGEPIEVVYKGATVRLIPVQTASKLARAKRQRALLCDPDAIISSDPDLLSEFEGQWRNNWRKL